MARYRSGRRSRGRLRSVATAPISPRGAAASTPANKTRQIHEVILRLAAVLCVIGVLPVEAGDARRDVWRDFKCEPGLVLVSTQVGIGQFTEKHQFTRTWGWPHLICVERLVCGYEGLTPKARMVGGVNRVSVPKTLSELMTRRNPLSCWNDRADPIYARRPGVALQVEESARS